MYGKKILAVLLTAAMFLSAGSGVLAASADSKETSAPKVYAAGETSGSCGDAMNWSYNESTSVLTISGSGTMKSHPWTSSFKSSIVKVTFTENITSICDAAFTDCTNLSSVSIPDSVTEIGYSAFKGCKNLDKVTFGRNSNLNTLGKNYNGDGVFQNCVNLSEITLPEKLTPHDPDQEILNAGWYSREELKELMPQFRTRLVKLSFEDYFAGSRYPLSILREVRP